MLLITIVAFAVILAIALFFVLVEAIGWLRSISYSCFFIGGEAIAIFLWMAAGGGDPVILLFVLEGLIRLVAVLGVVGLIFSLPILRKEKPLVLIIGLTIVLVPLVVWWLLTRSSVWFGNFLAGYMVLYALVCLAAPIGAIVKASRASDEQRHSDK